jgi:hypothetical protein
MRCLRLLVSAALAAVLLLVTARPGLANSYPAKMTLPASVEAADCIAVGKVIAIEEKAVQVPPFPGSTVKIEYRIAVVKIEDTLKGPKGVTEIRVAFQPPPPPPPPPKPPVGMPNVIVVGPGPSLLKPLVVGNEGCFLVKKRGDETFYRFVDGNYNDYLVKGDPTFDKKMSLVKRSLSVLADPTKGLQSKDAADRLLTATLLLSRFQAAAGPKAKMEPIEAAQSKLILEAIASADWSRVEMPGEEITPRGVFMSLRLTPKDGWNQPQQGANQDYRLFLKDLDTAAQKWLKDNSATYRIQRWVPEGS